MSHNKSVPFHRINEQLLHAKSSFGVDNGAGKAIKTWRVSQAVTGKGQTQTGS